LTIFLQKLAIFLKTNATTTFLRKLLYFESKVPSVSPIFFGKNIFKIITLIPGTALTELMILKGSASFLIRTSVNAPIIFRKWQIEKRFSKNDFVQRRTERVSMVRKK
jgi:hypothetical protein